MKKTTTTILLLLVYCSIYAQKPRARDIGVPFDGTTGKFNAITDVKECLSFAFQNVCRILCVR